MAEPSGAGDSIPLECPGLDMAAGEEFLQEVFQILLEEGVRKSTDVTQKVCDWKEPQELRDLLDLELRSDGEGRERLLQRCRDVLRFSVRTGVLPVHTSAHQFSPRAGPVPPGLALHKLQWARQLSLRPSGSQCGPWCLTVSNIVAPAMFPSMSPLL